MGMKEKIGLVIGAILLALVFVFFFMSAEPEEPKRVWVPGHYEIVHEQMRD